MPNLKTTVGSEQMIISAILHDNPHDARIILNTFFYWLFFYKLARTLEVVVDEDCSYVNGQLCIKTIKRSSLIFVQHVGQCNTLN